MYNRNADHNSHYNCHINMAYDSDKFINFSIIETPMYNFRANFNYK
jgi:hypothetical protein